MQSPIRESLTKCFWGLLIWMAWANPACAQNIRHDEGAWLAIFGNGKFQSLEEDSSLRWWFDSHYRMTGDTNGFNQSIIRPGLGYALNQEHALWGGYAWIRTSPILPAEDFDEHRTWQQWTYTPSLGSFAFLHRSRLEQRMVETGNDVGLRWRQMARAQYNLPSCPGWALVAWDEAFIHLNDTDWGARAGFDQNRAFFGIAYKPNPESSLRLEIGYLNQYLYRPDRTDTMNHLISLNIFF